MRPHSDDDAPRQPSTPSTPTTPAAAPDGVLDDKPDALDAWYRLTGSWPSPKVRPWLTQLADTHGDADVEKALAAEWTVDSDRATLLSRTSSRLERDRHEDEKRATARRAEREAEERRQIETMSDEQRAANMQRLGAMLRQSGILSAEGDKP